MLLTRQPSKTEFSFRIMQSDIIISASLGRDNFLNIGLVPPMTARGISRGLLGNYDGDQSNDLKSKGCVFLLFFRMPFPPPNFKGFFTDVLTLFRNAEIDNYKSVYIEAGADLGGGRGGGGADALPSGIRPPADPKGPPFDTFSEIHFWPTDPKIFLKAPSAPIYTNFEGERAPKKRDFFVKIFQKLPKNGFFDCFFKNLPAAQKI